MLNKNPFAQVRTCERIKFDQALYILTMYQKKIRTQIKIDADRPFDIDKEYDQKIIHSWNGKWKVDLTKPLLNCVTSVHPRIVLKTKYEQQMQEEQEESERYTRTILDFIRRMRVQHQDQSNFKLVEIDFSQNNENHNKFYQFAMKSCTHFLNTIESIGEAMRNSIQQNGNDLELQEHDEDNYCFEIGGRIQEILQVTKNTMQNYLKQDLMKFITSTMSVFDSIKQSEHGSTLLTVMPKLDEFTYILHPLFLPIYAYFLKEKQDQKLKFQSREDGQASEPLPFKNFYSSNTSALSKFVFINLDGYESQFNLQFARCFRKNMMYVSFPRQDIHYANDMNSIYEQRLYKKIMYYWQKNKMQFNADDSDKSDRMYFMTHNIENYFANVQSMLYRTDSNYQDLNRNMFIFPLRLATLNQNFNNLINQDEDDTVEVYESYMILQIFKYFLVNQIKQFGATSIIISHSGRLNIEDSHFVQIMQQCTKLSHYKIMYFPNLTTRFCPKQKKGIDHEISIDKIDYLQRGPQEEDQRYPQTDETNVSFDFFNKIARFLKISSGTHSLTKNFEYEDLLSKNRNLNVLRRINRLMEVLGNQYENIQRIRFKSTQIDLIPKLYQKDSQKIVKAFQKLIPLFYIQLYQLVESIISVCLIPGEKKAQLQLNKYNIDPDAVKRNYVIQDLISFIKNKIIVRNVRNQSDRQQIMFEKVKKYLHSQKQKHFLQISEQKYEDSILLHFKTCTNMEIYDNVQQGKSNLSGLIDVSFSSPNRDLKECMQIFDSTQILYKLDQSEGKGNVPILIMNHLPLQRKNVSKFDNYCAFLNRETLQKLNNLKSFEQGIQKIYQQKKLKPHLIKFYDEQDRQIVQSRFQFRTQWNYFQNSDYMFLFWPQLFNFVQAISNKLQGKCYEPSLLNQFFIAKKQVKNDCVHFYKAGVPEDVMPRTGCSVYMYKNFMYIFGGFYQKSKNYLSLQRDVTLIDLNTYNHDQIRKLNISNYKNQLYEPITIQNQEGRHPFSYIRTRRQFQFFDVNDLSSDYDSEPNTKQVVMVGGIGQNFIHPFSLLTYYYYLLKFQEQSGRLTSVTKRICYNKSIPVNISKPTKNMGIIKTSIRNKNQVNGKSICTKPQMTEPHSYARFRIVYKLQRNQFKYKFQYVFSQKDCKMLKQQLRKYQQQKYQVSELSNIRIQKIQGMNHMFMIQKYDSKQIVHLRLQIDGSGEQREQQYKLTHDSISFLNIINGNYICAVVKHPIFTNCRSLLVQCKVKTIQNQNLSEDQAPYVTLKPMLTQLKGDLSLHILEASNVNLIYVLHGHRLCSSQNIFEYQITHNRKSGLKAVSEIKAKKSVQGLQGKSLAKCCFSTFFYKKADIKNEIICESYLNYQEDGFTITRVDQYFSPSDSVNMCWILREPLIRYIFCLPSHAFNPNQNSSPLPVPLERITFLDFYRQQKSRIIIAQYNRKKYVISINDKKNGKQPQNSNNQIIYIIMEPATQTLLACLDEQQYERGVILMKKPQHYEDRGYLQISGNNSN